MAYPILAPNSTWYKGTAKRATITQIDIVDSYTATGSENEFWNADTDNIGSIKCYRTGTVLTIAGNGSEKIAMNADSSYLFSHSDTTDYFSALTIINGAETLDSSNTTNLGRAFQSCRALTSVDVSTWNTDKVTNMAAMCQNCNSLITLDVSNWNTTNVTDMRGTFNKCIALTTLDVSKWDVSNVTSMYLMFQQCERVTALDVSKWDVSNVTDMKYMFAYCFGLSILDVSNWNTSKVTDMGSMFSQGDYGTPHASIKVLDVSNWDVSNVTNMGWMFYGLQNVETLDLSKWDVSKVESFHHFAAHAHIEIIGYENWNVSSCKAFNAMFYTCKNTFLDLSKWDVSNGENFAQMFEWAKVEEIKGLENWNTSNGKSFYEMFKDCQSLKKLDLSSFDTSHASINWTDPWRNNEETGAMYTMFRNNYKLEEIILGENFSFNGDGTCTPVAVFPTPSTEYIESADGNWYDIDGNAYAPTAIPNKTAGTYYAAFDLIDGLYLVKRPAMLKLAKTVRYSTQTTEKMTIDEMCEALNNNDAFEAGKQAQYDEFWDSFQQNGERTIYYNAFSGNCWNNDILKPKYLVKPPPSGNITSMFQFCNWSNDKLNKQPIDFSLIADKFDFSQVTSAAYTFQNAYISNIYADFSNCNTLTNTFNHSYSGRTTNVTLKVSEKTKFSGTFNYGQTSYVTFTDDSVIGQNGLNLTRWEAMQHDNLMSVINALKDYSEDTSGTQWVVTLGTTNLEKLSETEKAIATEKGWTLA